MYDAPHYKGSEKLIDKVALITGGDSGIGRAVAVLFAREGADVAIAYLNEHEDADRNQARSREGGPPLHPHIGRRRRSEILQGAVARTVSELGGLESWSTMRPFRSTSNDFEDLTEEHFDRTIKTNLYGYFHMAKAAVPQMKTGQRHRDDRLGDGLLGNKKLLDYSMTKGGIHAFTRSLATHLIDQGIRVNVVAPGPVWTPLNPADRPAERGREIRRRHADEAAGPAGGDRARLRVLAAPSCSSYITGEILPIIGGYSGG